MQNTRRVLITSVLGLIGGGISLALRSFVMGQPAPLSDNLHVVLTLGILGFVIGISSLRWHWALHGLVWGGIFGVNNALDALGSGQMFIPPLVTTLVWGFLIELITTVVFKAGAASEEGA